MAETGGWACRDPTVEIGRFVTRCSLKTVISFSLVRGNNEEDVEERPRDSFRGQQNAQTLSH